MSRKETPRALPTFKFDATIEGRSYRFGGVLRGGQPEFDLVGQVHGPLVRPLNFQAKTRLLIAHRELKDMARQYAK